MVASGKLEADTGPGETRGVRDRILETAARLFYRQGVHAVGVDLVVAESGIAKTSLYRHFGSKDALVAAFLEMEDADFWRQWDAIAEQYRGHPEAELAAYMDWMSERLMRPGYRGCPQLNVAAEIPDPDHPARKIAKLHKERMRDHLSGLAKRLGLDKPNELGRELALAFDGAFISATFEEGKDLAKAFRKAVNRLLDSAKN